jgi:hypothetical protein
MACGASHFPDFPANSRIFIFPNRLHPRMPLPILLTLPYIRTVFYQTRSNAIPRVKFAGCRNLIRIGSFVVLSLALISCGKKLSPKEADQARLAWNLKTLVAAYQRAGHADVKWDADATSALKEFAHLRLSSTKGSSPEDSLEIIRTSSAAAIGAGCDDPMIRYLDLRFGNDESRSREDLAKGYCQVAHDIEGSPYPGVRKFYAAARALNQLYYTYGTNEFSRPEYTELWSHFPADLDSAMQDPTTPGEEIYEVCTEAFKQVEGDEKYYQRFYADIEPPLLKNWPHESATWMLESDINYQLAWFARGGGYANGISADAWKVFFAKISIADDDMEKAWKLDPTDSRIPSQMIAIAEAGQKQRPEMEMWFTRAMALNHDNYDACKKKLHYLYPQWYGSRDDMIAFGRECVASTNWGGEVPIILVDAHWDYANYSITDPAEREAYWKQPDVWPDIKSAYDKFFSLNPGADGIYKNYAWFAYHAEQWQAFNELAPQVRPDDYYYFGGKDQFDKMVQNAKAQVHPTKAPQ